MSASKAALERCPDDPGTPPLPMADESDLVRRLRAGDPGAEEEFVRSYAPRMLTVAGRYFRCEQDQSDAVQDAFITAFRAIESFSGQSKLSTWLHRIVVNACLMKLRSQRSRPNRSIEELLPQFDETGHYAQAVTSWSDGASERLASSEFREQIRACIDRLPDPYRTVILLRDIEQYDTQETANLLGDTTTNVKTRLHRARQALRTLLEPLLEPA